MRVLATIGFSFSAGVFLAALLPWNGWQLYAAGGVLLLALACSKQPRNGARRQGHGGAGGLSSGQGRAVW